MYLPRVPCFNFDRSYSGRSSSCRSLLSVFFFIMYPFTLRWLACADNPDVIVAVCVGNDQNSTSAGHANSDKPLFRRRMIRIGIRYSQRITKYGGGFLE